MEKAQKHHIQSHKIPPHLHELSKRLQNEVDHILKHVDERMLYAEFHESEVFDIQNGDKREMVRHTLDERISIGRTPVRNANVVRIEERTAHAVGQISRARKMAKYLFKPLEY